MALNLMRLRVTFVRWFTRECVWKHIAAPEVTRVPFCVLFSPCAVSGLLFGVQHILFSFGTVEEVAWFDAAPLFRRLPFLRSTH